MSASLLGLPLELRLEIYKLITGSDGVDFSIPCCHDVHKLRTPMEILSAIATRFNGQHTPLVSAGLCNLCALMCAHSQLKGEITTMLFSHITAKFCITEESVSTNTPLLRICAKNNIRLTMPRGGPVIYGMGCTYSAYDDYSARNLALSQYLQNFQTVELCLNVADYMPNPRSSTVHHLLNKVYPSRDNLSFLIRALNSSRSLQTVRVYFQDLNNYSADLGQILRPFLALRHVVKLTFFRERNTPGKSPVRLTKIKELASSNLVKSLERHMSCPAGESTDDLIDTWIALRAWLLGVLPDLGPLRDIPLVRPGTLDARLQKQYDDLDDAETLKLRDMLEDVWQGHHRGDKEVLMQGKQALIHWWQAKCIKREDMLMRLKA